MLHVAYMYRTRGTTMVGTRGTTMAYTVAHDVWHERGERDMRHMCGVSCGKREALQLFSKLYSYTLVCGRIYITQLYSCTVHTVEKTPGHKKSCVQCGSKWQMWQMWQMWQ